MLNKDPDELFFLAVKQTGFDDAAAEIEKLVLARWSLASKSGDDIFKLIGLNKAGDRVFDSLLWSTWVNYLNKHNDADEVMFTVLRAQYGDD
ncbi:hypothetical protein DVH05_015691 [Phytophthora capsici]|nr:hypothetical protein DVH05_015691 [Phytophthora capsici]